MPMPQGFLKQYTKQIFVETGFHRGDGIQNALDAGFTCIYSCDVSEFAYGWCSHRFDGMNKVVHLVLQDSRAFLRNRIGAPLPEEGFKFRTDLGEPVVFWLDAHWCGGNGEVGGKDGGAESDHPLLEELAIIGAHPIRQHTILIDDVRQCGKEVGWPTLSEVEKALEAINPEYDISFEDGAEFPRDILVAQPR